MRQAMFLTQVEMMDHACAGVVLQDHGLGGYKNLPKQQFDDSYLIQLKMTLQGHCNGDSCYHLDSEQTSIREEQFSM